MTYLVRAGDRARSLFAYDEAAAYYADALRMLDGAAEDDRRPGILDKLGDTAYAHGALAVALDHWAGALALVEARGDRRRPGRPASQDGRGGLGRRRPGSGARAPRARPGGAG